MIEPLRLSFAVACSAEHAFATWTAQTSLWWPSEHTVSGEAGLEVHFEPRAGGRVYERTPAGREVDWGEVVIWEPPARLAYLWHISARRADATDVEITFTEQGDGSTRIEIVHGGWERLGAAGPAGRDENRGGWQGVLPAYIAACSLEAKTAS